jgi:hypothetical protein
MTWKEYGERAEAANKGLKVAADIPATGESKDQLERRIPGITLPDGKPFYASGDQTEAKKLRAAAGDTTSLVGLMDKIVELRAKYGWSSDLLKSPEWQQMQASGAFAQLVSKGEGVFQLGVLTGPDVDIIGKATGIKDPTELRDPTPGIKAARVNLIDRFNEQAFRLGYPTKNALDIPFIDTTRSRADTVAEKAFKTAERKPKYIDPAVKAEAMRLQGEGLERPGLGIPEGFVDRVVMPEQKQAVEQLAHEAASFRSSDAGLRKGAETALNLLEDLARGKGGNAGIQALALAKAQEIRASMGNDPRVDKLPELDQRAAAGDTSAAAEAKALRELIDQAPAAAPVRSR